MRSSTSSSEPVRAARAFDRVPVGNWSRVWTVSLALVVALLAGWETVCRLGGFEPSFQSDARLWAMTRRRVPAEDREAIVLIGTSRVLLNLDIDTWTQVTGRAPVQLGVNGCTPLPFLAELASDASFRGLVVCGVAPPFFFDERALQSRRFREFYEAYRAFDVSPGERVDQKLGTLLQGHLAFRHPALAPPRLVAALRGGTWPAVPWVRVRSDREQLGDFERADAAYVEGQAAFYEHQKQPASAEARDQTLALVELAVARIRERGGEVVFVRFPTKDRVGESERRRFPRERYWDRLASRTQGVAIHGADYPGLLSFRLPDGSHLDYRDAPRFTGELLRIIAGELSARGDGRLQIAGVR